MNRVEGLAQRTDAVVRADVVVVGSGPAGAAVAREAARAGARVVVVEEGPFVSPDRFPLDTFHAMALLYRDLGASVSFGNLPMPVVQGRAVGGTSVVNGAISWRLPRDVWDAWVAQDPALADALPWQVLCGLTDEVEADLGIAPTDAAVAGPKNLLMARGAETLGLAHRPIARNVRGCEGLGRCLQGCPAGHKQSMERTYLPQACAAGAVIHHDVRVERVEVARGRAVAAIGRAAGGGRVRFLADRAVVLAASAVQTPGLLMASGLGGGAVGRGFMCHPGVAVAGRFREPVRLWTGATQGHEVIGLRAQGLKFEVLGYDAALAATRARGVGVELARGLEALTYMAHWGCAIKASARGRVVLRGGRPQVRFSLLEPDLAAVRRGVRVLGDLFFAAGAVAVEPGVHGMPGEVTDPRQMARFEEAGPRSPKAYSMAVTHLFGTCRMGDDPASCVVRPDFRHHQIDGLYVADSSVFPTNTGVNPQTSILALATLCGRNVVQS